ncbi:hypothetical protein [Solilutibacter pythonis]|nr:hypothetical protein [Lysobacter pythonis]
MAALVPLLLALAGLGAVAVAAWLSKDGRPASPGLALRMALTGIAILLGAIALYLTGNDANAATWITLSMALTVNLLAVSMWLHLRRPNPAEPPCP